MGNLSMTLEVSKYTRMSRSRESGSRFRRWLKLSPPTLLSPSSRPGPAAEAQPVCSRSSRCRGALPDPPATPPSAPHRLPRDFGATRPSRTRPSWPHTGWAHGGARPHPCPDCPKAFSYPSKLAAHPPHAQRCPPPHPCPIFLGPKGLCHAPAGAHLLDPRAHPPYPAPDCPKSFWVTPSKLAAPPPHAPCHRRPPLSRPHCPAFSSLQTGGPPLAATTPTAPGARPLRCTVAPAAVRRWPETPSTKLTTAQPLCESPGERSELPLGAPWLLLLPASVNKRWHL